MKKTSLVILMVWALILVWGYFFPVETLLEYEAVEAIAATSNIPAGQEVAADDIYAAFADMEKTYTGSLPWNQDERFCAALAKMNNPAVIAAYRATLHDPLPGEGFNIGLAADKLAGTVVQPGATFSQNRILGPYTVAKGYRPGPTYKGTEVTTTIGGGVCKVASVLYNAAVFCDFEIVQRFPHSMTVPYVPPGQDATVFYGVKDFKFKNNTDKPILIWAQKIDKTLYVAIYGFKQPPKVVWHHRVLKRFMFPREYKYNAKLARGEERVVVKGQEGLVVRSWVTVDAGNGEVIIKRRGVSYYRPSPELIEAARR